MSGVRRHAAHRLTQAWNTVPHVFQHDRADITAVEALRKRLSKKAEADKRAPITITAFLMKTLAAALKEIPADELVGRSELGRNHLQAVRPHRRGGGHRSRSAGAGDSRRRSEGHGSDRRRHRAGGGKSPHAEAVAGRHAGRLDDDFQSRRPGRGRLHADRELARGGHSRRRARAHGAGLRRRPVRAAAHDAADALLRSPRHRRRRRRAHPALDRRSHRATGFTSGWISSLQWRDPTRIAVIRPRVPAVTRPRFMRRTSACRSR